MKKIIYLAILTSVLTPAVTQAIEYSCSITKKLSSQHEYTNQEISKGQYSVLIEENKDISYLSRCSFVQSANRVTCDRYTVDKTFLDKNVNIKKYYVFQSQFDVQLFSNLTIIENNGRGGIAFGKCSVTSP